MEILSQENLRFFSTSVCLTPLLFIFRRKERRRLRRLLPQSKLMQKAKASMDTDSRPNDREKEEENAMGSAESENESGNENLSSSEPETNLGQFEVNEKDVVEIDIGVDEMID